MPSHSLADDGPNQDAKTLKGAVYASGLRFKTRDQEFLAIEPVALPRDIKFG